MLCPLYLLSRVYTPTIRPILLAGELWYDPFQPRDMFWPAYVPEHVLREVRPTERMRCLTTRRRIDPSGFVWMVLYLCCWPTWLRQESGGSLGADPVAAQIGFWDNPDTYLQE
jgi:hypothetical protein